MGEFPLPAPLESRDIGWISKPELRRLPDRLRAFESDPD
jgi:hypothetical protein